jgi:O-antigen/teichoic acid export membrane protein
MRALAMQSSRVVATGWRELRNSGTASMAAGQLARLGTQALYFVIAARALGPGQFGAFAAAAALAGVVAPFATWGASEILLQDVSRSRQQFRAAWGAALHTIAKFGCVAILLTSLLAAMLLPAIPLLLVIAVAMAEFWFAALIALAANAHQAVEDFRRATRTWLLLSIARLGGAALVVLFIPHPTAVHWGVVYVLSSGVAAAFVTLAVTRRMGSPQRAGPRPSGMRGFQFAVSTASASISAEVGKMSLSRFDRLEVTGAYAAADRIVGVVSVPILAVLSASYPRLHRAGLQGMCAALRLCAPLLAMALLYACGAALVVYFSAPLIEPVLGAGYHQAILACQFLSGLLVLRTLTFFAANCLTATNQQRWRSVVQVGGACLSAALAIALVRHYSWQGAAAAALASETLLAVVLWALVATVAARERAGERG